MSRSRGLRRGGQVRINNEEKHYLRELALHPLKEGVATSNENWETKVEKMVAITAMDRGQGNFWLLDKKFASVLRKELKLRSKIVECGFAARLEVEHDIKTCVSTLSLFFFALRFVSSAHLIVNYDAAQYISNRPIPILMTRCGPNWTAWVLLWPSLLHRPLPSARLWMRGNCLAL